MKFFKLTALACALLAGPAAQAADAASLGKELTPLGGERAANSDGSIPAWDEGGALKPGWTYGQPRVDFFKYKDDKQLFTIDASNADKYADKLSEGQIAVMKAFKNYKLEVYPSRRYCSSPDFVQANTKANVGAAKIGADGWSLAEATVPGVPFPLPKSGIEVLWNAKMKYVGVGLDMKALWIMLSPRSSGGDWVEAAPPRPITIPGARRVRTS